jgi:hypothetical protein
MTRSFLVFFDLAFDGGEVGLEVRDLDMELSVLLVVGVHLAVGFQLLRVQLLVAVDLHLTVKAE